MKKEGLPPWALDALNSEDGTPVGPYLVREITVAGLALLQRIGSPVATGILPESPEGWYPTVFVLTRPAKESRLLLRQGDDAFLDAVEEWTDTVPAALGPALVKAVADSVGRLNAAVLAGGDGKEGPEDGPPPHAATAGR